MLVITLTSLIIITKHTSAIDNKSKSILEVVIAPGKKYLPDLKI